MRIAISYEDGNVFPHFGRTAQLKIYEVDNGKVEDAQLLATNGVGHGALSLLMNQLKIEVLICGGIGSHAMKAMRTMDIQVFPGVSGNADDALDAYLAGTLDYDTDYTCSEHEDTEFSCSSGSCGSCNSQSCH